jgi:hypothetical protein
MTHDSIEQVMSTSKILLLACLDFYRRVVYTMEVASKQLKL